MNRPATKQKFKDEGRSVTWFTKRHNFDLNHVYCLLRGSSKVLITENQRPIIAALKADGLYVPSDNEGVSVSTVTEG